MKLSLDSKTVIIVNYYGLVWFGLVWSGYNKPARKLKTVQEQQNSR